MVESHYRINTIVLFLVGAYSDSQGLEDIRKNVVKYISERDGYPSDPSHIYLTSGASEGIRVSTLKISCLNYNQKGWKLSYRSKFWSLHPFWPGRETEYSCIFFFFVKEEKLNFFSQHFR